MSRSHFPALIPALATAALLACSSSSSNGNPSYTPTGTGPAASLKCDSSGKNAFDTYGTTAFVKVNEAIFTNVATETGAHGTANLGDAFTRIGTNNVPATMDDLPTFKGNLAAFLVYVYGGPQTITYTDNKTYVGPQDMGQAHAGLNISSSQYDYFVSNIVVPALTSSGVPKGAGGAAAPNDVASCFAPPLLDPAFKAKIVNNAAGTGAGVALKCDSSGKNAWDTYGANAFIAVNEAIFKNVASESAAHGTANLGDAFTKVGSGNPSSTQDNLAAFKGNLAAFLVYTYGGPSSIQYTDNNTYQGPQDMAQSHLGLNITSSQYDYFVTSIVVPALTASGVPHGAGGSAAPNDVGSCFAPPLLDAAFKASIVGK